MTQVLLKEHKTAVLLAVGLGTLGIDRFYLGHYVLGFLKLITGGFFGIWWIADIVVIATKNTSAVEWYDNGKSLKERKLFWLVIAIFVVSLIIAL